MEKEQKVKPTFFLWHLRLRWNRGRGHQQVLEVLLEDKTGRSVHAYTQNICTHSLSLRHSYSVLVGHDKLLDSLLPHLEHLGALVIEQGELLQHHVLGRLDLGAQVEFRGLRVRLVI